MPSYASSVAIAVRVLRRCRRPRLHPPSSSPSATRSLVTSCRSNGVLDRTIDGRATDEIVGRDLDVPRCSSSGGGIEDEEPGITTTTTTIICIKSGFDSAGLLGVRSVATQQQRGGSQPAEADVGTNTDKVYHALNSVVESMRLASARNKVLERFPCRNYTALQSPFQFSASGTLVGDAHELLEEMLKKKIERTDMLSDCDTQVGLLQQLSIDAAYLVDGETTPIARLDVRGKLPHVCDDLLHVDVMPDVFGSSLDYEMAAVNLETEAFTASQMSTTVAHVVFHEIPLRVEMAAKSNLMDFQASMIGERNPQEMCDEISCQKLVWAEELLLDLDSSHEDLLQQLALSGENKCLTTDLADTVLIHGNCACASCLLELSKDNVSEGYVIVPFQDVVGAEEMHHSHSIFDKLQSQKQDLFSLGEGYQHLIYWMANFFWKQWDPGIYKFTLFDDSVIWRYLSLAMVVLHVIPTAELIKRFKFSSHSTVSTWREMLKTYGFQTEI